MAIGLIIIPLTIMIDTTEILITKANITIHTTPMTIIDSIAIIMTET
jgi:hypothetical protein